MHPILEIGQRPEIGDFPLFSWDYLLVVVFLKYEHSFRHDLGALYDSHNLASQQMLFLPCEKRIRNNRLLQVACEDVLDLPSNLDLLGSHDRQFHPFSLQHIVTHPILQFINSRPFGLHVGGKLSLFSRCISDSFCD